MKEQNLEYIRHVQQVCTGDECPLLALEEWLMDLLSTVDWCFVIQDQQCWSQHRSNKQTEAIRLAVLAAVSPHALLAHTIGDCPLLVLEGWRRIYPQQCEVIQSQQKMFCWNTKQPHGKST